MADHCPTCGQAVRPVGISRFEGLERQRVREGLKSDEAKLRAIQAVNTGVHHGLEPAVLDNVIEVVRAAALDSLEDSE